MVNSILITGANGFIGSALCTYLAKQNLKVVRLIRNKKKFNMKILDTRTIESIDQNTNWKTYLKDIDTIIHTAGYSSFPSKNNNSKSNLYNVNVLGTLRLAEQAVKCKVKRLIYISSIKVHGENTKSGMRFNNNSEYNPQDEYALSKVKTEIGLEKIRAKTSLDIVIIRPPLVYGKGVKSNLLKLIYYIDKGIPLPFKSLSKNKISLIALENLSSLIFKCITYKTFLNINLVACDSQTVSTKSLSEEIAFSLNKKSNLFYCPRFLLIIFCYMFGKQKMMNQILHNLEIDNSYAQAKLNWKPDVKLRYGLRCIFNG